MVRVHRLYPDKQLLASGYSYIIPWASSIPSLGLLVYFHCVISNKHCVSDTLLTWCYVNRQQHLRHLSEVCCNWLLHAIISVVYKQLTNDTSYWIRTYLLIFIQNTDQLYFRCIMCKYNSSNSTYYVLMVLASVVGSYP